MENGDETLASPAAVAAAVEKTTPNGGVAEEEQAPVTHPAKSYAAVAAENPVPNGGIAKDEEKGAAGTHATARSYAAVAAQAEIEDLRAAKLDLEGKLAEAQRENETLAKEAHHMEGLFAQTREEVTIADFDAASAEKEAASLRAEVERLQAALKIEQGEHELDKSKHEELAKELEAVRQEKLKLEEEMKALKASAATTTKEREADPAAEAPKGVGGMWQAMAVAAAIGAAGTAAVVLTCLRLSKR
jgi:chromosome segregation ATPase